MKCLSHEANESDDVSEIPFDVSEKKFVMQINFFWRAF